MPVMCCAARGLFEMSLRKIGILGGMGPEATILLQSRLLLAVDASDDADHIPLLIDMNPQVPSRIDWLLRETGANPGPMLASMAKGLETSGAETLAMPCNTAHHFATDIEQAISIPFLNMPKLAAAEAAGLGGSKEVGILASPATKVTNLFKNALSPQGCTARYPADQDALLGAIKTIKAKGPNSASMDVLKQAADELVQAHVSCILIGCSEFSLMAGDIQSPLPVIDTIDVLVDRIVAFSGARRNPATLAS